LKYLQIDLGQYDILVPLYMLLQEKSAQVSSTAGSKVRMNAQCCAPAAAEATVEVGYQRKMQIATYRLFEPQQLLAQTEKKVAPTTTRTTTKMKIVPSAE